MIILTTAAEPKQLELGQKYKSYIMLHLIMIFQTQKDFQITWLTQK